MTVVATGKERESQGWVVGGVTGVGFSVEVESISHVLCTKARASISNMAKQIHCSLHPPEASLQWLKGNNKSINAAQRQRDRRRKRQQMRNV